MAHHKEIDDQWLIFCFKHHLHVIQNEIHWDQLWFSVNVQPFCNQFYDNIWGLI